MPEYLDAPREVLDLAAKLALTHPEADFAKARVKYMTRPMKRSKWVGRCYLAHGPWAHLLADYDYIVVIWAEWWDSLGNEARREPLLYHELCHIVRTESGRWALRQHPITEFIEVILEYGCWSPELKCLVPHVKRAYK